MTTTDTNIDASQGAEAPQPPQRGWLIPAGLALATLGLLGGLLLGQRMTPDSASVTDEVSVGFLRDMKTHHAQAVEMSEIVHRRSSDPALNYLAFDIMSTQQGQIGIMTGWLDLSRQSQSGSGPTMAWMGHSGPMPGMATSEQINELDSLPVDQMEVRYLQLMIEHHRGALNMAQYAADNADSGDVANLARNMNAGQASEIGLMEDLLAKRGAAPQPSDEQPGSDTAPSPSHTGH